MSTTPKKFPIKMAISGLILASALTMAPNVLAQNIPVETIHYSTSGQSTSSRTGAWNPQPISTPWYAGGELGIGESANSNVGLTVGANVGYSFNSNLAMEFNFLRLPYPNKKSNFLFASDAKISLPIANQLISFGKIGLGLIKTPDQSHLALLLGGGVNYFLQTNVSVGAELLGTIGTLQAQSFSILGSANYYFGARP